MSDQSEDRDRAVSRQATDRVYAQAQASIGDFRFDQSVVDVFPDMLDRSIPGYRGIITQSGLLAARHAHPGTRLYDLGSSLGATSLAMRRALDQPEHHSPGTDGSDQNTFGTASGVASLASQRIDDISPYEIHAIDSSPAMIERCRTILQESDDSSGRLQMQQPSLQTTPIVLRCEDLQQVSLTNASVVAMNFTLQFVPPVDRAALMQRIARALVPGGALIISEKLAFEDPAEAALHVDMYHAFKRANGYSDLEISQKRTALEAVLIPDTLRTHRQRLADAGFSRISLWFQCFNFASIIALRD